MMCEAGAADADGFIVVAGAAAFFGELRKSNRRRVRLDPASQFEQSWVVAAHALFYGAIVRRLRRRRRLAVASR